MFVLKYFVYFSYVSAVNQYYEAQVYDMFVIKGNAAVFKCNIPSFVSDYVDIVSWQDTDGTLYLPPTNYGTKEEKFYIFLSLFIFFLSFS